MITEYAIIRDKRDGCITALAPDMGFTFERLSDAFPGRVFRLRAIRGKKPLSQKRPLNRVEQKRLREVYKLRKEKE